MQYKTSEKREALWRLLCCPFGWLRSDEPIFRHWDRLPTAWKEPLKQLTSDEIKDDIWHLRL